MDLENFISQFAFSTGASFTAAALYAWLKNQFSKSRRIDLEEFKQEMNVFLSHIGVDTLHRDELIDFLQKKGRIKTKNAEVSLGRGINFYYIRRILGHGWNDFKKEWISNVFSVFVVAILTFLLARSILLFSKFEIITVFVLGFIVFLFLLQNAKLLIYDREHEIKIMSLVGASSFFIKSSFVAIGLIIGCFSAFIIIVSFVFLWFISGSFLNSFMFLSAFSLAIAIIPSFIAVKRYLLLDHF